MRIAFCAIVLDNDPEHKQVAAMLDSARAVGFTDWVIAVDSKSVPGTEQFIREKVGGDVFSFDWRDDFAYARNLTLARIPEGCEWWGWADSDDTIQSVSGKTVPEILAETPERDGHGRPIGAIFFDYDYARDEYGNSTTTHTKGRLYRSSLRWEWRNRVHEDCYPIDGDYGKEIAVIANEEDLLWVHHIDDRPSSYTRNMRILRKMLEDDPNEPRTWYYLGNQCFAQHEWLKAAEAYEKYVGISGWDQERWTALIYQGISYQQLQMFDKAIESYTRAMLLLPELPDSYFGLGESYTRLGEWEKGRHFGELGIQRVAAGTLPDKTVFFNANAYQFNPYLWLATCYWNLGEHETAVSAYEQAYKARPDKEIAQNIEHLKWALARDRIIKNGIDLAAGLIRRNEPLKARAILDALPAGASERSDVRQAKAMIAREVAHLSDDTAYRNFYFKPEGEVDLKWLSVPSAGIPRFDRTLRRLAGAKKVLQVGVGDGLEGLYLAQNGLEVVGIDVNPLAVKAANWAAVRAGLMGTTETRIATDEEAAEEGIEPVITSPDMKGPYRSYHSDLRSIHEQVLAQGPFDAVVAAELIEHVPDPKEMLAAVSALAPRVILATPDGTWEGPQSRHPQHVRAYSLRELITEVAPYGAVVDAHPISGPADLADELFVQYLPDQVFKGEQVVIYCGNTGQGWSPDSLQRGGIGGSETAVIRVAEELAKRGKRVKVWAECEGIWNNVSYSNAEDFVPWECDAFISWRSLAHQGTMKPLAAQRFVWAHDVHFGPATAEQLEGITALALSEWHRGYLAEKYPTANIVITANGIDPERFDKQVERIPHRLIYAQSPDRGLDALLKAFPEIRAEFPDAELHVFYGMDLARSRMPLYIASLERLADQPGVALHGRIDQEKLAEEYLKADALVYPAVMPDGNPFTETYCISVVEAQAAGCIPITPSWGALGQTNAHGKRAENMKYALRELTDWFRLSPSVRESRRADMREWARQQTWARVADQWCDLMAPVPA